MATFKINELINTVSLQMNEFDYTQVQRYIENIPEQHHDDIVRYIKTHDYEMLGKAIMLSIHQQIEAELYDE